MLAVHDDLEGVVGSQEAVATATAAMQDEMQAVIQSLTPDERRLAFETYYMGERFRYAEMTPFLEGLTGGSVALYRGGPGCIYAAVTKPKP